LTVLKPLLLVCLLLPLPAAAEQTITVYFDDLPSRETRRTAHVSNELTMDVEGDPEMIAEMEAQGAKFPFSFLQRDEQVIVSKTEEAKPDRSFVFERKVEKWASFVRDESGKERQIETPLSVLEGLTVRGTHHADGSLAFIDFRGGDLDDEDKKEFTDQLAKMMELFDFNAFTFPSKEMSVGDSVSNEMAASIPVPGQSPAELEIVSTHRLDKIEGDSAYFSTQAKVTLEDSAGQKMTARGKGTGEMVYAISDKLFIREVMEMEIHIDVFSDAPGAKMTLDIQGTTKVESELVAPEKAAEAA
jgi:hypothetical protein